jgi:hypothetical protein
LTYERRSRVGPCQTTAILSHFNDDYHQGQGGEREGEAKGGRKYPNSYNFMKSNS